MLALPNVEDINQKTVVQTVKDVVNAIQELSDSLGTQQIQAIHALSDKVDRGFHKTNQRLESMDNRLGNVENRLDTVVEEVKGMKEELKALNGKVGSLSEKFDQQTDLLRQIAHNTAQR